MNAVLAMAAVAVIIRGSLRVGGGSGKIRRCGEAVK